MCCRFASSENNRRRGFNWKRLWVQRLGRPIKTLFDKPPSLQHVISSEPNNPHSNNTLTPKIWIKNRPVVKIDNDTPHATPFQLLRYYWSLVRGDFYCENTTGVGAFTAIINWNVHMAECSSALCYCFYLSSLCNDMQNLESRRLNQTWNRHDMWSCYFLHINPKNVKWSGHAKSNNLFPQALYINFVPGKSHYRVKKYNPVWIIYI